MLKNLTVRRWLGLALIVVSVLLFSGCCARLQSPIVFENCCGWSTCGSPCWDPCGSPCGSPCQPNVPCNPSY